jgi:NAD(P)-dependent dehydrogenase (short-subunit alcohol dehydrogenase family)
VATRNAVGARLSTREPRRSVLSLGTSPDRRLEASVTLETWRLCRAATRRSWLVDVLRCRDVKRFERRTALITGGGHGIGRACALRLADEGASIVVADIDLDAAEAVSSVLARVDALAVRCDVIDQASVDGAVRTATDHFGGVDVLIHTAGGDGRPTNPDDPDDDHWSTMLDLNLLGVVRCIRACLPSLVASSGGNAVVIGSINGLVSAGSEPYSAAKAALSNLIMNLAARHGRQGVRFNLIAPATIRTRVWDDQPNSLERLTALYPLGRAGTPDDVAAAVAFLASDDAAWITGITLPVDGGLLAAGPIRLEQ